MKNEGVLLVTDDERIAALFQGIAPLQIMPSPPPLEAISSTTWAVIAATHPLTKGDAIAWLAACRTRFPFAGRLLILRTLDPAALQWAINVAQVTQVLLHPTEAEQVREALKAMRQAVWQQSEAMLFPALLRIADWGDAKTPLGHGHTYRVLHYAWAIGRQLHLSDEELAWLRFACVLHDLGQLAPSADAPWGAWLAEGMGLPQPIADAVRYYPERRSATPLLARLIALADTYDGLLAHDLPLTAVRARLQGMAAQLGEQCVQALLSLQEPCDVLADLERHDDLPVLAPVVQQALGLLMREDFDWQEVADTLSRDEKLAAHLLRLANSAITGFRRRVTNLPTALRILGARPVTNLLLTLAVRPLLRASAEYDLWRHSLGCALLARAMARRTAQWDADEAFAAALLHDLGKSLLWRYFPEASRRALEVARRQRCPSFVAERLVFGTSHAEVGGWLLQRWRLPPPLPDAIAAHHNPFACPSPLAWCVYWADALWNRWAEGKTEGQDALSPFCWQDFHRDGPALVAEAQRGVQEIECSLGVEV